MAIEFFQGQYRFLSNFYPAQVILDGTPFPTVEHAYQAAKAIDYQDFYAISQCKSPGEAKQLGKRVPMRYDWEKVKDGIMYELLVQKFKHKELRKMLLDTGNQELVEGNNWHDNYWGRCTCSKCWVTNATEKAQNKLGNTLMVIREQIREGKGGKECS